MVSVAAASVATDTGNAAGLADAHVISVAAFTAAAGSVALPACSVNSSNSSESDLVIIGGGCCAASGRKSTGLPNFSDQPPMEDYFSADGDDVDNDMVDDMPTDAEASNYSFLDRLEHYMERALITEDNCKAVELAIMVEAGTTAREMDPMKKEVEEKAFLNSFTATGADMRPVFFRASRKRSFTPNICRNSKLRPTQESASPWLPHCLDSSGTKLAASMT